MTGAVSEPLHPEVVAMLEAQRQSGAKPRSAMTVEETRHAMLVGRRWQLEPPSIEAFDADADGVPVRVYGPASETVLLYLHGGRFFSGGLESHDWPLRTLAVESGCRICAVDYRLAPEHRHPAALEDAIAAGQWLVGSQTQRLVIGGDSAGGYLAALASIALKPERQILIYPMLDPGCATESYHEYWQGPWPSGEDMKRGWDLYGGTPVMSDLGTFPPTLLITAGIDSLRDEAFAFADGLRANGVTVDAHHYADMHHGFFTQTRLTRSRELITLIAAALRQ